MFKHDLYPKTLLESFQHLLIRSCRGIIFDCWASSRMNLWSNSEEFEALIAPFTNRGDCVCWLAGLINERVVSRANASGPSTVLADSSCCTGNLWSCSVVWSLSDWFHLGNELLWWGLTRVTFWGQRNYRRCLSLHPGSLKLSNSFVIINLCSCILRDLAKSVFFCQVGRKNFLFHPLSAGSSLRFLSNDFFIFWASMKWLNMANLDYVKPSLSSSFLVSLVGER